MCQYHMIAWYKSGYGMQALLELGADPRTIADDGAYPEQVQILQNDYCPADLAGYGRAKH